MGRRFILLGALAAAVAWAVVAGTIALERWPPIAAAVAAEKDRGVRGCATRYFETDGRERCQILFDTQYVMERNMAIFTRLLIVFGPLVGAGVWAYVGRDRSGAKP